MWAEWFWIDRWRRSTAYMDMTLEEQGAFRNLIDELWLRDGVIPNNERTLAKACGDATRWKKVKKAVLAKFYLTPQGWRNKTHDEVSAFDSKLHESQSGKGKARAVKAQRGPDGTFQPKVQPELQPDAIKHPAGNQPEHQPKVQPESQPTDQPTVLRTPSPYSVSVSDHPPPLCISPPSVTTTTTWLECVGGTILPGIADELGKLQVDFGETAVCDAIKASVRSATGGVFNVNYVRSKLDAWRRECRTEAPMPLFEPAFCEDCGHEKQVMREAAERYKPRGFFIAKCPVCKEEKRFVFRAKTA